MLTINRRLLPQRNTWRAVQSKPDYHTKMSHSDRLRRHCPGRPSGLVELGRESPATVDSCPVARCISFAYHRHTEGYLTFLEH
jgi:hypothetical protein